jgi:hypothetical protein
MTVEKKEILIASSHAILSMNICQYNEPRTLQQKQEEAHLEQS